MEKKNHNKSKVAGLTVAAVLLAGFAGGSAALWSDTAASDGATITTGNLDVAMTAPTASEWTDLNPAKGEDSRAIDDIAAFRLSPADSVQTEYVLQGALEGDNLEADFALDATRAGDDALPEGISVTYEFIDSNKETVASFNATDNAPTVVRAVSPEYVANYGKPDGSIVLPNTVDATDGTAEYIVRTTVNFDAATPNQVSTQKSFNLGDFNVALTQVTR